MYYFFVDNYYLYDYKCSQVEQYSSGNERIEKMKMDKITASATGEVLDQLNWFVDNEQQVYLMDLISEVADSHVPVYTNEIIELAKENFDLVLEVSELVQPDSTPLQAIGCNIYEHINDFLQNWAEEQKLEELFSEVLAQ